MDTTSNKQNINNKRKINENFECGVREINANDIQKYMQENNNENVNTNCCLTRSEIYAVTRETIMKRKNDWCINGVCDHLFDSNFNNQMKYIRDNLKKARIFAGDSVLCKRLSPHIGRLQKIFEQSTNLEQEFNRDVAKYGSVFNNRNIKHVRRQRIQQNQHRNNPAVDNLFRKKEDSFQCQRNSNVRRQKKEKE